MGEEIEIFNAYFNGEPRRKDFQQENVKWSIRGLFFGQNRTSEAQIFFPDVYLSEENFDELNYTAEHPSNSNSSGVPHPRGAIYELKICFTLRLHFYGIPLQI